MNVFCRAWIAVGAMAMSTLVAAADEAPSPEQLYRDTLANMQRVTEPAFVTYRTVVPSGHTSIVVKSDENGFAKVTIRASSFLEPERSWNVAYRGADGAATIDLPGQRRALTEIPLFDPTWRGAFRWMRHGIIGGQSVPAPENVAPAPDPSGNTTPPPVIAVVEVLGPNYYDAIDAGPLACSDGRPGHHLHLIARSDPVAHPLTDVVIDETSSRFCTMRFHQVVKSGPNNGFFDIDLHFADKNGYYLINDGRVTGGLRIYMLTALHLDTTFTYEDVQFPPSLPAELFAAAPGPAFTAAPLK